MSEEKKNQNGGDLAEQFTRIAWLLHRFQRYNQLAHGPMGDPLRGQGRVLSLLKLKPEISQKELSYLLDMRPQSLGELLAKLERGGYITRTPSESDRRVVDIKLTEEGAKVANEGEPSIYSEIFDNLSKEEKATLSDYLGRLIATMEQQLGDEPDSRGFGWFDRRRGREGFDPRMGGPRGRRPFPEGFDPRGARRGRGRWMERGDFPG